MKKSKVFTIAALSLCLVGTAGCSSMTNMGKGALIGGGGGAGQRALRGRGWRDGAPEALGDYRSAHDPAPAHWDFL